MSDPNPIFQEDYKYVQQLLLGESEAWNRFYKELHKKLGIYLNKKYPKLFNVIVCEEVLDGVGTRLISNDYRMLREYRGECSFSSYLTTATEWEIRSWLRKHSAELSNVPLESMDRKSPKLNDQSDAPDFSLAVEREDIPDLVKTLKDDLRLAFLLRYYDFFGFPLNEIRLLAKKKGVSIGSITQKITQLLEPSGQDILSQQRRKQQAFREKLQKICFKINKLTIKEHNLSFFQSLDDPSQEFQETISEKLELERRRDLMLEEKPKLVVTTPYEVIAEILGDGNVNTIRSRIFLAKKHLKEKVSFIGNQQFGYKLRLKE